MAYKVNYKSSIIKDLKKLDKKQCTRLINKIERELSSNPKKGKELTGEYKGLYSYRVGDYRVIYTIFKDAILILKLGHRKNIYKSIN